MEQIEKEIRLKAEKALEHSNNLDEQKEFMRELLDDAKLVKQLAEIAFEGYCDKALYEARCRTKAGLVEFAHKGNQSSKISADAYEKFSKKLMMDSFYCGDKPIGQCDSAEVLTQAQRHQGIAAGNQIKANIFFAVAKKCRKETKLVSEQMSEKQLVRIINKESEAD